MNHFCIITNSDKRENHAMVKHIVTFLQKRGLHCMVMENTLYQAGGIRHFTNVDELPPEVDCAIVLGGDGTIIQAAIDLVHRDLPILGVNTGTLGFLTEVEQNRIDESLERLLSGEYLVERRMMLKENRMFKQPDSLSSCYALNDMVVSKRGSCRLITDATW